MSSKQFTRQAILWIDQVNEDHDLPLGGIKIAKRLLQRRSRWCRMAISQDHQRPHWPVRAHRHPGSTQPRGARASADRMG